MAGSPRTRLLGLWREGLVLLALGLVPTILNAAALLPEVSIQVPNLNDDAEHFLFVQRASDSLARGENPLDLWIPQLELGFPQFLYYQHLPHLAVVLLHRLLFEVMDLRTLFDLVRYALLLGLPLTVYASMRLMSFGRAEAAIGAAASTLLSGAHRYGFEYDSYVWRGFGVYTQLFGMHLAFLSLATLYRVASQGRGHIAATLACSALALSHLIYAYMTGITAILLLLLGARRAGFTRRLRHLAIVGALTAAITSYMWLPFLLSSGYLYASPFLDRAKYDSFGAGPILGWLATGDLLDHGRLPVLTALLAAGIVAALVSRTRLALLTLTLFLVWLALYSGRPTLGALTSLLPMHENLLFHRFIGAVDLFAILLIGLGGGWLWRLFDVARSRVRLAAAALALLVLLAPAMGERWTYYADNSAWMRETQAALEADRDAVAILEELRERPPGRVYAGLRSNWGQQLNFRIPFNSVRFYNLLTHYGLDAVAPPYRGASLNSDLAFYFNEGDLSFYRLFNVGYVVAPPGVRLPPELKVIKDTPRYLLYAAPGGGYAGFVGIAREERATSQLDLFEKMRGWLLGSGPAARQFVRYDYLGSGQGALGPRCPGDGRIVHERVEPSLIEVLAECPVASNLVLKVTYHPNWIVSVDERPVRTSMVSPSYLSIEMPAGLHFVRAEYRSTPLKAPLLLLGVSTLGGMLIVARRPSWARRIRWPSWPRLRAPLGWDDPLAAGAIVACLFALFAVVTPPISFNAGLGDDGAAYYTIVRALRDHVPVEAAAPYVYRIGPLALIAASGLDIRTAFVALNVLAGIGAGALLFALLRRYRVPRALAFLGVIWWAALPMGPRFSLYYPVLLDGIGFFLHVAALYAAVTRRLVVFAALLAMGVATRESLLVLAPFLWLVLLREQGVKRATRVTLTVAAPAVLVLALIRVFPPVPPSWPYDAFFYLRTHLDLVLTNTYAHGWRYLLAVPLTLGMLFVLPLAFVRRTLGILRAEPWWAYYVVAMLVLALVAGRDDDRLVYPLAPALLVLTFAAAPGDARWSSPSRLIALTVAHLVAVRFLWPVGPDQGSYLSYAVSWMDPSRLLLVTAVGGVALALGVVATRALDPIDRLMALPATAALRAAVPDLGAAVRGGLGRALHARPRRLGPWSLHLENARSIASAPGVGQAVAITLGLRAGLGLIALAGARLYPRDWAAVAPAPYSALLTPESSPIWWLVGPWERWDALHYAWIATRGYVPNTAEVAFPPLFPAAMRVVGGLLGSLSLGGLAVSTVSLIIALALLHRLVTRDFDGEIAARTILYLAIAPTAFFLFAPYSEALFLALSVGVFVAARSGRFVLAGGLAAIGVLCRLQGALLVVPLAVELALDVQRRRHAGLRLELRRGAALVLPALAYVGLYLWVVSLGFPRGPLEAHERFWRSSFGRPLDALQDSVRVVLGSPWQQPYEVLNLAAVLAVALAIPLLVRSRAPWSYTFYALASGLAMIWRESAFTPLMSADRFVAVVFPVFVLLGLAGRRPWVDRLIIALLAPLQAFLLFHFSQYFFVG